MNILKKMPKKNKFSPVVVGVHIFERKVIHSLDG